MTSHFKRGHSNVEQVSLDLYMITAMALRSLKKIPDACFCIMSTEKNTFKLKDQISLEYKPVYLAFWLNPKQLDNGTFRILLLTKSENSCEQLQSSSN